MQKILIVIDMQNDFVTGSLGSEAAQVAAKNIAAHINEYDTVIFTRDTHGPDYLDTLEGKFLPVPHCIKDTEGWEIIPELVNGVSKVKNLYVVDKDTFGTFICGSMSVIYPHHNFSMVSDSYDYWNLVEKILPHLKDEIMAHDGCLSIRGDSGDPVEIIAGKEIIYLDEQEWENLKDDPSEFIAEFFERDLDKDTQQIFSYNGEYALADITVEWTNERGAWTDCKYWYIEGYDVKLTENYELTSEDKGTVWCLWDIFGGTINSKGYRVLDPHIKAIYGDSITPQRCARIYQRLENNGFAINNVSLGVGSFSFMCLEEDGSFNPYTRDTFGIAVKATYAEDANGKPIMIYKQPKALSWKKSQKGCCRVALDGQSYEDELTWADHLGEDNLLQPVFRDGNMIKEDTLHDIRARLYKEGF